MNQHAMKSALQSQPRQTLGDGIPDNAEPVAPSLTGEMWFIAEILNEISGRAEVLESAINRLGAQQKPMPETIANGAIGSYDDTHLGAVRAMRTRLEWINATVGDFCDRLNSVI